VGNAGGRETQATLKDLFNFAERDQGAQDRDPFADDCGA